MERSPDSMHPRLTSGANLRHFASRPGYWKAGGSWMRGARWGGGAMWSPSLGRDTWWVSTCTTGSVPRRR